MKRRKTDNWTPFILFHRSLFVCVSYFVRYIKNGIQKHHGKTAARRVLLTLAEDIVAELGHNARR